MDIYEWCVRVLCTSKQTKHSHTHKHARVRKKSCGFFGYLSIFVYVVVPLSKWHLVKLLGQSKFCIIYVWRRIKMEGRKQASKKNKRKPKRERESAGGWMSEKIKWNVDTMGLMGKNKSNLYASHSVFSSHSLSLARSRSYISKHILLLLLLLWCTWICR